MKRLGPIVTLAILICGHVLAGPVVFWASDPVQPDETVVLLGDGLAAGCAVEMARLADGPAAKAADGAALTVDGWTAVRVLQAGRQSVKAVVPADWPAGVYAVRVRVGGETSAPLLVNAPDPWWVQADEGRAGTPGGWLRVFGKCLHFAGQARVLLRAEGGAETPLEVTKATCWALTANLPQDVTPGRYDVLVHHGLGGAAAWRKAGELDVVPPVVWKTDVFAVAVQGEDAAVDAAIHEALDKARANGGGVVFFPRGTYDVKGPLVVPPHTVLRGQGMGLSSLHWPDFETPPESLIVANDCAIEDLSLYCRKHDRVITNEAASERLRLSRVRIRANAFMMLNQPGETFRGRKAPERINEGYVLRLTGRNLQIADCDLWGSGAVLSIDPHGFTGQRGPWHGVIHRNRIAYGSTGHLFENVDCLIFEDNDVMGRGTSAGGNGISSYWNNFSRHIYYANNHLHDIYGVDREALTLDADGAAYCGKAGSVEGTRLVLAEEPQFRSYAPVPHTDYRGAVVYILDGTGAGQYRTVTANAGRDWTVDRPWDVPPDGSSFLSIVPFRGQNLFIGNKFEDCGPLQMYGSAADVVIAGNKAARMDGLFAWGLSQHGWGWHPAWRCQFLDNELLESSGYGARVLGPAFLGVTTGGGNEQYSGPLARANIFRRNVLHSDSLIRLEGNTDDTLVEDCTVRHSQTGVRVDKTVRGTVLRRNKFQDVTEPLAGDGAAGVRVVDD